jgi:hypothetical protein
VQGVFYKDYRKRVLIVKKIGYARLLSPSHGHLPVGDQEVWSVLSAQSAVKTLRYSFSPPFALAGARSGEQSQSAILNETPLVDIFNIATRLQNAANRENLMIKKS